MPDNISEILLEVGKTLGETAFMCSIALVIAIVAGGALGILLYASSTHLFINSPLLNKVLATEGWHIDDAGELTQLAEAARTFDDIERLTSSLVEELQRRGTHERLMEYCSQELIAESLFHAISEAAKSIPDRIRILTSLTDDGQELFDAALGTNNSAPKLVINSFSTESEKSEHKGFKNLLIGIHGHYRNPRAHKTRLGSEEGKHDFLDAFSLFSYVHRRLDSAQRYQSFM